MIGIPPVTYWQPDPMGQGTVFLTSLLPGDGLAFGTYDGRVTRTDNGIRGPIDQIQAATIPR
jgi:hypothetical protein